MPQQSDAAPAKPNLFIVGAAKCGTTAWFEYLGTHPEIFVPDIKEPHFFAEDMPGKRWTTSLERYRRLFARAGKAKIAAEASVMYLYSKVAARRIHEFNPQAKILIFLRAQEKFLPSLHHQYIFTFAENVEDFGQAWRLSGKRSHDEVPDACPDVSMLDYAAIGRFHEQVARYFALFPRDQVKIVWFDDWTADPRRTYLDILAFLGLDDDGRTDFQPVNEAKSFRFKWLGRLITHPPRALQLLAGVLRKISRREALGLANRASSLLASRGYTTKVTPELSEEIVRYYEEDNRKLVALLAERERA